MSDTTVSTAELCDTLQDITYSKTESFQKGVERTNTVMHFGQVNSGSSKKLYMNFVPALYTKQLHGC